MPQEGKAYRAGGKGQWATNLLIVLAGMLSSCTKTWEEGDMQLLTEMLNQILKLRYEELRKFYLCFRQVGNFHFYTSTSSFKVLHKTYYPQHKRRKSLPRRHWLDKQF